MVKRLDDAAVARVLRDNIPNAATRDTYLARLASLRKLLGAAAAAPDVASVLVEADPRRRMIPKLKRTVKEGVRSVLTVKNMVGAVLATHKHLPAAYAPTSEARAAWAALDSMKGAPRGAPFFFGVAAGLRSEMRDRRVDFPVPSRHLEK